jgi:hypothetical protein
MGILLAECDIDLARPGPRHFIAAHEELSAEVEARMNEAELRWVIWRD